MTRPLILDVDGTFLKNDLTHEMVWEAVRRDPARALQYLSLGLRDKPAMKQAMVARIGDRLLQDPQPLEPAIVALAKQAKADGRSVYLCSGSEDSLVQRLAARHDFIDGAFGTSPTYNMTSANKAAFLRDRFPDGFDYAGNSTQDFAVWEAAQEGFGIRPPPGTDLTETAAGLPVDILIERSSPMDALPLLLRGLELWKLLVVLLPILLATVFIGLSSRDTLILALSLATLFLARNVGRMLKNVPEDRTRKRAGLDNPVATGTLSVPFAAAAYVGLAAAGLGLLASVSIWPALLLISIRVLVSLFKRVSPSDAKARS
ncbi:hypothetical protein [uncultured Algimonas sp.]|uniref:hypothetical protein n=1 Tax=uncultured Algimonas sp. TaxID=1547920 RepID=UPI002618A771|nr:hypothetical protein [uncultured Algimonas sp.]